MNNITFKTKDVDEAAFFWTMDEKFELTNVETTTHFGRPMVWFNFLTKLSQEELNNLKNDYRNGRCLVEPRKYSYRRSEVKSIIHERHTAGN